MLEVIQVLEKNDLEHMENIFKKCILLTDYSQNVP